MRHLIAIVTVGLIAAACSSKPDPSGSKLSGHQAAAPRDTAPTPPDQATPTVDGGGATPMVAGPSPAILAHAAGAADLALDQAYARHLRTKNAVGASHQGSWVAGGVLRVEGDATAGWTLTWSDHPPAGFEFDVVVTIGPRGDLEVGKATASFASE